MSLVIKAILGLTLGVLGFIVYSRITHIPPVPVYEDVWWGKGDPSKEDTTIRPYKIDIPKSVIDDLKYRLDHHIPLQEPLDNVHHNYGINSNLLQKIVDYWKLSYNWTERQSFLNQFPQYTVSVQGLKLHYIHVKPKIDKNSNIKVLPLMILHGWPGSVREFYELIPFLTQPQKGRKVVFEVIAPSLPGYGFSEATSKPGLGAPKVAQVLKNFMLKLGFNKFYVQGGDWGGIIVQFMSILYPDNLFAAHSNLCVCLSTICNLKQNIFGLTFPSLIATEKEIPLFTPIVAKLQDMVLETGYFHIQATRPDTVGVALRDSPVGLAAYIIEKFIVWTNSGLKHTDGGGLIQKFSFDKLLDNVMIYWVTRSITTSQRLYSETFNKEFTESGLLQIPVSVPTACARFKNELMIHPKSVLESQYLNLVQSNLYDDGGHFIALEKPDVLAKDIYEFIEKVV